MSASSRPVSYTHLDVYKRQVWYGARDEAFGACGGVTNLFMEAFPNRPALVGGILGEDCREVLSSFFAGMREGK